jgi:hypothetical protein
MQRDIIIRRVMIKFTQIPQSLEELSMCVNNDTRRNGIMTPLTKTGTFYFVLEKYIKYIMQIRLTSYEKCLHTTKMSSDQK